MQRQADVVSNVNVASIGELPEPTLAETLDQLALHIAREDITGGAHFLNCLHDRGCGLEVRSGNGAISLRISDEPPDFPALLERLLDLDVRLPRPARLALVTAVISCAQTLYRRGDPDGAQAFLDIHLKRHGANHVIEDVSMAQARFTQEGETAHVLVRNLAIGGLDYREYFKDKYCGRPFDTLEIRFDGEIFNCCPSLVPDSIGNAYGLNTADELKASPKLANSLDAILSQDFRYCRWLHCDLIMSDHLLKRAAALKTIYAPEFVMLSYDPTCNLRCPSCRTEKIVAKGAQQDQILKLTGQFVIPLLKGASYCMMNGYGDVFSSRACRRILEASNPEEFPNLKYGFITNGILFTRAQWQQFPGIHRMTRYIRISIDAARRETYDRLRLGGDWDILMENLDFISQLRRSGMIDLFDIHMVVQEDNFEEMVEFGRLGQRLGCDKVMYDPLMNWNSYPLDELKRRSVHAPDHPRHPEFLAMAKEVTRIMPSIAPMAGSHDKSLSAQQPQTVAILNFGALYRVVDVTYS